jgi:alkanesulfonate monooxygenase SsuD/methylene tetrahydromethanopterin reductase-like flavin-dependent oxidoreductase (luciferase family)
VLGRKLTVLDAHLAAAGRTRDDVAVTVLDLPVIGRDREDAWARVERLRGRTPAAAYARRTSAGTVPQHRARYAALADLGVSTVFVGVRGLQGPDEVLALAGLNR